MQANAGKSPRLASGVGKPVQDRRQYERRKAEDQYGDQLIGHSWHYRSPPLLELIL